jgi:hypothetical protein
LTLNLSGQVPVLVDSSTSKGKKVDEASELIFTNDACLLACGPKGTVVPDSNGSLVYLATIAAKTDPSLQYWFPVGDALALACIATWMSFGSNEVNTSTLFVRIAIVFAWKIPIALETDIFRRASPVLPFWTPG